MTHTPADALEALTPVARALEALGVAYYVGGSIASSAHGLPRSTHDADVIAALRPEHAMLLKEKLGYTFYMDVEIAADAIRQRRTFNLIYTPKMLKVDIFPTAGSYDLRCLQRAVSWRMNEADPESAVQLASPEDTILHKLAWYRDGGQTSERQWLDVLNVLKVQAGRLDDAYMEEWADALDVFSLLRKAKSDAAP